MSNEVLRDLINTGFNQTRHVQPWAWRYAKQLMDRACALGLARPFDFGRGKGKYTSELHTPELATKLEHDPQAIKVASSYRASRTKRALDLFLRDGRLGDFKKDSVFLSDLEHELTAADIPYTVAPPLLRSGSLYVSLRREEATANAE